MKTSNTTKRITKIAIVTALYCVLVLVVPSLSFGAVQFRVAEMLNFLVIINPIYAVAITVGVFLSNFFSSSGGLDLIFGPLHTMLSFGLSFLLFKYAKSTWQKFIFVGVSFSALMLIIAFELALLNGTMQGFWPMYCSLFLSEACTLGLTGIIMYKIYPQLQRILD